MINFKIRIGGVPEHFNLPWHLATENGLFREAGLDVEFVEVGGGTGAMTQMLNSGTLDAAVLLTEGGVADICNGSENRLVQVYASSPLIWGIHVSASSELQSIEDIRGRRYAISRFGSGSHLMAIVDAAERGWPVEDVEFVVVRNLDGARKALAASEADVFLWEKFMTKPLVDSGEFRIVGQRVVPWPSFVVSVRKDLLKIHADAIRQTLQIAQHAASKLMNDPLATQIISQRYHLTLEDTIEWFGKTKWCGDFEAPSKPLDTVLAYLERLNVIEPDQQRRVEDIWFDLSS